MSFSPAVYIVIYCSKCLFYSTLDFFKYFQIQIYPLYNTYTPNSKLVTNTNFDANKNGDVPLYSTLRVRFENYIIEYLYCYKWYR